MKNMAAMLHMDGRHYDAYRLYRDALQVVQDSEKTLLLVWRPQEICNGTAIELHGRSSSRITGPNYTTLPRANRGLMTKGMKWATATS